MGERMSENPDILWSNSDFGNCFLLSQEEQLEADCCEPKTRAEERSGMCATIITATVHSDKAQSEFYTARLAVGVPACVFFFSVEVWWGCIWFQLHTPALKWFGVKGSSTCFQFLSSTWQFGIRSRKTVSPTGINKVSRYHFPPGLSGWRLISERHLRRSGSTFSFRFFWKIMFNAMKLL